MTYHCIEEAQGMKLTVSTGIVRTEALLMLGMVAFLNLIGPHFVCQTLPHVHKTAPCIERLKHNDNSNDPQIYTVKEAHSELLCLLRMGFCQ